MFFGLKSILQCTDFESAHNNNNSDNDKFCFKSRKSVIVERINLQKHKMRF